MKFRQEVQEQFRKAGWFEGRNIRERFDSHKDFDLLPSVLKEFLYEYGELEVETLTLYARGTFDLRWSEYSIVIKDYIEDPEPFEEDVVVFPIGLYPLDAGLVGCSEDGTIYIIHDYPAIMSHDFKEGIEKIIMEDYKETKHWDEFDEVWVQK